MVVYLIHFDQPIAHAQHYIGWAEELEPRIAKHKKGQGARILKALVKGNIPFHVVRTWEGGDRTLERQLKKHKKAWRLCPVCRASKGLGKHAPKPTG